MNMYFVSCPDIVLLFLGLSQVLIQFLTLVTTAESGFSHKAHPWLHLPRKKQQGALSSLCLKWLEMDSDGT